MRMMAGNALRDVLNRLRWDAQEHGADVSLAVRVRRRGAEVVEQHDFAEVAEVAARGVTLRDGTFLPFHRVLAVFLAGRPVWSRRGDR